MTKSLFLILSMTCILTVSGDSSLLPVADTNAEIKQKRAALDILYSDKNTIGLSSFYRSVKTVYDESHSCAYEVLYYYGSRVFPGTNCKELDKALRKTKNTKYLSSLIIPVTAENTPQLYRLLVKHCEQMQMSIPPVYIVPCNCSNAGATSDAVFIYTKLLAQENDLLLAGTLAHELAHIKRKHAYIRYGLHFFANIAFAFVYCKLQQKYRWEERENTFGAFMGLCNIVTWPLFMAYSRAKEKDADLYGSYSPEVTQGLLQSFRKECKDDDDISWMKKITKKLGQLVSTHPTYKERVAYLEEHLKKQELSCS